MDIDPDAPITATGSVVVSASPPDVWAMLSDISRWPSWDPDVREARLEGDLEVGSRFRWRAGLVSITSVLRSVDPYRELGWTGATMGLRAPCTCGASSARR